MKYELAHTHALAERILRLVESIPESQLRYQDKHGMGDACRLQCSEQTA
jgi:hypothetical protein